MIVPFTEHGLAEHGPRRPLRRRLHRAACAGARGRRLAAARRAHVLRPQVDRAAGGHDGGGCCDVRLGRRDHRDLGPLPLVPRRRPGGAAATALLARPSLAFWARWVVISKEWVAWASVGFVTLAALAGLPLARPACRRGPPAAPPRGLLGSSAALRSLRGGRRHAAGEAGAGEVRDVTDESPSSTNGRRGRWRSPSSPSAVASSPSASRR